MSKFLHWLGIEDEARPADETMAFDPTQALRDVGVTVPEPIEIEDERVELPSDVEPVSEAIMPKPTLDAYREGSDLPVDLDMYRTRDSVEDEERQETEYHVDEEELVSPAAAPVGINPKDALGMKKPDLSLIPPAALLYEAQGMMDGAAKYGPYNWRENPVKMRVYIAAAMRHMQQLLDREDFDPISDVHHIGHARCCMGILADAIETGNIVDDRPIKGPAGDMIRRFNDTQSFRRDGE
jgi:hypothetical protein